MMCAVGVSVKFTGCSNSPVPIRSSPACCEAKSLEGQRGRRREEDDLGTVDGDVIGVETETGLLVNEEIQDLLALVALELNHLAGLFIIDLVAIASYGGSLSVFMSPRRMTRNTGGGSRHTKFLPEEGENLAGVEFSRKTSDRGQRLATISLCSIILANVER